MDTPQPTEPTPAGGDDHRMPRWVKGFIIAAVTAAVLAVVVLTTGSSGHGPSRHLPGDSEPTTQAPQGHTPPFDHG